ncbi:hypothetical protein C1646_666735 [Rhizophagus diaphanus]|nr:hypothetical protein C1646_666735 [Rhizophagus diaphanus] [Rhizophagus sp. MUCL 43196]
MDFALSVLTKNYPSVPKKKKQFGGRILEQVKKLVLFVRKRTIIRKIIQDIPRTLQLYGISNVHPILASNDNYVFWLEDTAGIIYMWSHVEWSMSYLGRELREALVNYLFYQDNICYVVEFTHEFISKNEIRQKAKELADSCEPIDIDDIE